MPARLSTVGAAALASLPLLALSGGDPLRAAVLGGLLIVATFVLVKVRMRMVAGASGGQTHHLATPLAAAWLLLTVGPTHSFSIRSNTDAVQSLGADSSVESLYFLVLGVFALAIVRSMQPTLAEARVPVTLLALPLWSFISFLWSSIFLYTFARGAQMVIIATLGWATIALGRRSPDAVETMLHTYLRWFVRLTIVLVVLGAVFGPIYVPTGGDNLLRFTWIGAHPNSAGLILALSIVILVTAPLDVIRVSRTVQVLCLGAFGLALYQNNSRTSLVCVCVGLTYALVLAARRSSTIRFALTPYVVALVVIASTYFRTEILDYFYRGQDAERVSSGNGRQELWSDGYRLLDTTFDWLFGLGFGQARVVFLPGKPWAKSAHSSMLAILVSLGLVGVVLFAYLLVRTIVTVLRSRMPWTGSGAAMTGMFLVVFVNGIASDIGAEPNIGFTIVCLTYAIASVRLHHKPDILAAEPAERVRSR